VPCNVDGLDADRAGSFAAIILGPEIPLDTAIDTTRAIDHAHPETSVVLVARDDPETLKAALRAGARDVWAPDVRPEDLSESLTALLRDSLHRAQLVRRSSTDAARSPSDVIVVLAAKGGTGQTMIATGLANSIAARNERSVAIVDLDLQFGDVAEILQLGPDHDIADAVATLDNLPALKTLIPEHPNGIHVLGVPSDPAKADSVDPQSAGRLVATIGSQFQTTIVDAGDGLSEHALAALDHATSVVVVTTPNPFVVSDTQRMLAVLDELDLASVRCHLVLNHASDRSGLRKRDLDETLRWPIDATFATSSAFAQAMMRGQSIEEVSRSARKAMRHLVDCLLADTDAGGDTNVARHGR
jgi:pilus assembly protein CpaE